MFTLHFGTLNITLLSKIGACLLEEMDSDLLKVVHNKAG